MIGAPKLLSDLTTIRVGGPAGRFAVAADTEQLIDLVRRADADSEPVLVMSGGSNLVVGDRGFDGLVVQVASSGLAIDGVIVRADAGVGWDSVVVAALDAGLAGLESLSGIPGSVGGTPIQNVGAYGTLTSDALSALTVYDRATRTVESMTPAQCGFGRHRQSIFKRSPRYVILDVEYTLARSALSRPIAYRRLADRLGVELGERVDALTVRTAVLALRAQNGMLLDPADHDTWSVGSFFLNPVVGEVPGVARDCPAFPGPRWHQAAGGLADQSRRLRPRLRCPVRQRHGRPFEQTRAGDHQPRRGHSGRRDPVRSAYPGRGRECVRHQAGS